MANNDIYGTDIFPAYTMGFLNVIVGKIKDYGMMKGIKPIKCNTIPDKLIIPIVSKKYAYCHNGINLVQKTLNRIGFNCSMNKYKINVDENNNDDSYEYHFTITKK